jgi:RNA-directed DNA polymerase
MLISKKRQAKKAKIRHAEYYDLVAAFDDLYARSKDNWVFNKLMPLITSEENILLAYRNIKRNKGSGTPGVDEKTMRNLEKIPRKKFIETVRRKLDWYQPSPVRRVEIPKPDGRKRPLGIPAIWDRIIQQCVLQVLEPICEAKFHERSNGFRPNRSAEHAIAQCYNMIQQRHLYFVVDIDIKGFFDNVDHTKLVQQMWHLGIRDKKLLCIIRQMLKAPIVLPDGSMVYPQKGTPQGGILSPLLSNIVLNELDWWIASQWEEMPTHYPYKNSVHANGSVNRGNTLKVALRTSRLKEMWIVRYADDFKIFCSKRSDADKVFIATRMWLKERLNLDISPEKSKVVNLKKSYSEFLGFKIKAHRKKTSYVAYSHMSDKAIKREAKALKAQIWYMQHPIDQNAEGTAINLYNAMVIGIHNYYQIATNVNLDCAKISAEISTVLHNRLGDRLKKQGSLIKQDYVRKRYGNSKQLRYLNDKPICPIGYVRTKAPMWKKRKICSYTPEGREEIHKALNVDMTILRRLMRASAEDRSIEFMDNRVSLYAAQNGKCAVLGRHLEYEEIHCHHKIPLGIGGTDAFSNLVILHADVHKLIHAETQETISFYLAKVKPDKPMLTKINKLRKTAGLLPINA